MRGTRYLCARCTQALLLVISLLSIALTWADDQRPDFPMRVASLNYCIDQQLAPVLAPSRFYASTAHGGRVEALLQWQPDLIIATPFTSPLTIDALTAVGLSVKTVAEPRSMAEVMEVRWQLQDWLGISLPSEEFQQLQAYGSSPRVLFYLANQLSFGADTLWHEVAESLGWQNLAAQRGAGLVSVSLEQVLLWEPDIMVFEQGTLGVGVAYLALQHRALRAYLADSQVQVIHLPRDLSGCMAQRLPEVLELLQGHIPE